MTLDKLWRMAHGRRQRERGWMLELSQALFANEKTDMRDFVAKGAAREKRRHPIDYAKNPEIAKAIKRINEAGKFVMPE